MPMGIVSDQEFDSERDKFSPSNKREEDESNSVQPIATIIESPSKGRGNGNVEVPTGLRKLIGIESVENGRGSALELANSFGIKPSSVSAYSQGANSTASYNDRPNLPQINQAKEKISKRARGKLLLALRNITKEKLEEAKVGELSAVARNMSAIVKDMEPDIPKNPDERNGPTFIFYSPQFRKEEHFDVIQAKE